MATITRAYGWESGHRMIPDIDILAGVPGTNILASSSNPKTGSYCLRFNKDFAGGNPECRFPADGTPSNPSISVWIDPQQAWDSGEIDVEFRLSTGEDVGVRWDNSARTFDAYVDGVKVADGTIIITTNAYFHLQLYCVIDNAGSINVKINGHESITYLGDTQPGAAATVSYVHFDTADTTNGNVCDIDDLVIGYGGYLGDLRCVDLRPNADTAQDDWTPSTGTDNYATIDETPENDSDYNETATDAHADELDMTDFDGATYIPVAVTAWVRARQDAGVGDGIHVGVDSNGTDGQSASQPLSNSWEYYFHTLDDNPDDAAEWADADIDALKLRYESDIP